jgi:hypothetical protein
LAAAVFTAGASAGFAAVVLTGAVALAAVAVFAALDFGAGLGLEAADALGDAVDGDLAMYSPTPRLERSRPMRKSTGANSIVSIRNDTGV